MKLSPEPLVDLAYYQARYPDLARFDAARLNRHFATQGRGEGRMGLSWLRSSLVLPPEAPDDRETVLVVLANADPTSAAALSLIQGLSPKYHVVTILQAGGELAGALTETSGTAVILDMSRAPVGQEAQLLATDLHQMFQPRFAVVGSLGCHDLAIALEQSDVPVVALMNEPASTVNPPETLVRYFATVSEVVFPTREAAAAMAETCTTLRGRGHAIALPGRPAGVVPPLPAELVSGRAPSNLPVEPLAKFLGSVAPTDILVIGMGPVSAAQGVDYFIEAAGLTDSSIGGSRLRFVWVGQHPTESDDYQSDLFDRWKRLPSEVSVTFAEPSPALHELFRRADLMFLSTRADTLPHAAIEAACQGIPTVCFDRASAFAEWLTSLPGDLAAGCVVPPLSAEHAARALAHLCVDVERQRIGEAIRLAATEAFGNDSYADAVSTLGRHARLVRDDQQRDLRTILAPNGFDALHYAGGLEADGRERLARTYLRSVQAAAPLQAPGRGLLVQRPRPGFHPLAYAESVSDFSDDGHDPFAHFLAAGSPAGRWAKRVITPQDPDNGRLATEALPSVLVHGHFHYPELVPSFLDLLATNQFARSLVLTTTTSDAADQLRGLCRQHPAGAGAEIFLVPNRGRNLSAIFTGPVAERLLDHEVVLHLHGKRSPHLVSDGADRWRDFLWNHLLGVNDGFGDQIVAEFARSERLGIVAPEDRHLHDWDLNAEFAPDVLERLGRTMPLPVHFDFGLGAMFWARTAALSPFIDADLVEGDYPPEPLPVDGTSLHALERLIPLVIEHDGYEFAKTHRADIQR